MEDGTKGSRDAGDHSLFSKLWGDHLGLQAFFILTLVI